MKKSLACFLILLYFKSTYAFMPISLGYILATDKNLRKDIEQLQNYYNHATKGFHAREETLEFVSYKTKKVSDLNSKTKVAQQVKR